MGFSAIEIGFYVCLAAMLSLLFMILNSLKQRIVSLETQNEGLMDVIKIIRSNLVSMDAEQKHLKDNMVRIATSQKGMLELFHSMDDGHEIASSTSSYEHPPFNLQGSDTDPFTYNDEEMFTDIPEYEIAEIQRGQPHPGDKIDMEVEWPYDVTAEVEKLTQKSNDTDNNSQQFPHFLFSNPAMMQASIDDQSESANINVMLLQALRNGAMGRPSAAADDVANYPQQFSYPTSTPTPNNSMAGFQMFVMSSVHDDRATDAAAAKQALEDHEIEILDDLPDLVPIPEPETENTPDTVASDNLGVSVNPASSVENVNINIDIDTDAPTDSNIVIPAPADTPVLEPESVTDADIPQPLSNTDPDTTQNNNPQPAPEQEDYNKMDIATLRSIAAAKGASTETQKMKKKDLVKYLQVQQKGVQNK
jgi:hypothetical protein